MAMLTIGSSKEGFAVDADASTTVLTILTISVSSQQSSTAALVFAYLIHTWSAKQTHLTGRDQPCAERVAHLEFAWCRYLQASQ